MKLMNLVMLGGMLFSSIGFAADNQSILNRPGRMCTVSFKKCDFMIGGRCIKWNNKSITVHRRETHDICDRLAYEYGRIRDCRIDCHH